MHRMVCSGAHPTVPKCMQYGLHVDGAHFPAANLGSPPNMTKCQNFNLESSSGLSLTIAEDGKNKEEDRDPK